MHLAFHAPIFTPWVLEDPILFVRPDDVYPLCLAATSRIIIITMSRIPLYFIFFASRIIDSAPRNLPIFAIKNSPITMIVTNKCHSMIDFETQGIFKIVWFFAICQVISSHPSTLIEMKFVVYSDLNNHWPSVPKKLPHLNRIWHHSEGHYPMSQVRRVVADISPGVIKVILVRVIVFPHCSVLLYEAHLVWNICPLAAFTLNVFLIDIWMILLDLIFFSSICAID